MESIASSCWHHNCFGGFSYQLDCFVNLLHCKFLDKIREENELSFSIWVNIQISNASILVPVDEYGKKDHYTVPMINEQNFNSKQCSLTFFCIVEHICCIKEISFSHFFILRCQHSLHNKQNDFFLVGVKHWYRSRVYLKSSLSITGLIFRMEHSCYWLSIRVSLNMN